MGTPTNTEAQPTANGQVTHAVASDVAPPTGSNTPNTASHTPDQTPYTGDMDRRGGKKLDDGYMANYTHLAGGGSLADKPTTATEADTLNKLRADGRRIEPDSLRTLQENLKIKNATGAMNTETLRKLQADHPDFSVELLLSGKLLGNALTISQKGGTGYGDGSADAKSLRDPTEAHAGEHKADAMARVAGFANYAAMNQAFVPLHLFGQPLGRGLPYLAERLEAADRYLRQRIPEADGETDRKKLKGLARQKLQWDGTGNGAYADNVEDIAKASGGRYGAHFHAAGMAIDIDPTHNPFVFVTGQFNGAQGEMIDGYLADNLRYAAQIYGGEEVTPKIMKQWSESLSSEELAAKIDMISTSLNLYLTLCASGTDQEVKLRFQNAGYPAGDLAQMLHLARRFGRDGNRMWQDNMSRDNSSKLTTHSMELIVALRDVAGLAWGGTEMSEGANGDFMHFDTRNTGVGKKLFDFAMANQGAEPAMPNNAQHQAQQGAAPPNHR